MFQYGVENWGEWNDSTITDYLPNTPISLHIGGQIIILQEMLHMGITFILMDIAFMVDQLVTGQTKIRKLLSLGGLIW